MIEERLLGCPMRRIDERHRRPVAAAALGNRLDHLVMFEVGGQEDMITEVALDLIKKKTAAH